MSWLVASWLFLHDPVALTRVLAWVALGMAASLVLLFVVVVVQRVLVDREARSERRALNGFALALVQGRPIASLPVDPDNRLHRRALARALAARGTSHSEHALLAAPWFSRLVEQLRADARRGPWGRRTAAYEAAGQLAAASLRRWLLESAARERHPQAWGACVRSAARLSSGHAEAFEVARLLQGRHVLSGSFNEGVFRQLIEAIVREADDEQAAQQVRALLASLEPRPELLHDALSAAGKSGLASLAPQLAERLSAHGTPLEVRIACARALGSVSPAHPALASALEDPAWQVQAAAARLLRDPRPATLARMRELLGSPSFHVRRNAALSLHQLGEAGDRALAEALAGPDAFAQAISRYALSFGEAHHG